MLEFGATIRKKREEKGWTQKELAEKLYVSDKAVSRWENNQSYPDITLLLEIASVLDFDYQELLEGQIYVQRQIKKEKGKKSVLIILLILFFVCMIMFGFSMNQRNQALGKDTLGIDFLNTMKWDTLFLNDSAGNMDIVKISSDYQSEQVLDCLGVNTWEKVDKIPDEWGDVEKIIDKIQPIYYLKFQNDIKLEEYYVFMEQNEYYVVFATEFYYGGILNNLFNKGKLNTICEIYHCKNDLNGLSEKIDKIPSFEFTYHHDFENATKFKVLTEEEILNMDSAYYIHDESRNIVGGNIFLTKQGPFYLYFTSNEENITKASYDNGILYLEGEPRKYTKPYVVVFEITNPDEYSQIHYNGERIVTFGYDFRDDSSVNN